MQAGKEVGGTTDREQGRIRSLRESFAALRGAPQRSAEQIRAAFAAAAKASPSPAKTRDYGAER